MLWPANRLPKHKLGWDARIPQQNCRWNWEDFKSVLLKGMNMFIPKGKKSPIKSKKNDAELRRHSFVCDTVRLSLRALGSRASTLIQFLARSRPVVDGEKYNVFISYKDEYSTAHNFKQRRWRSTPHVLLTLFYTCKYRQVCTYTHDTILIS